MAITITQQPNNSLGLKRAYEPLLYKVEVSTIGTAAPIVVAFCVIDGQPFGQPAQITHTSQTPTLEYVFEYDPKLTLQSYYNNQQSWGALNAQTDKTPILPTSASTGFYKRGNLVVQFIAHEQIPPSNMLKPTDTVTSNSLQTFNAAANSYSSINIAPFTYPAQWLHNYRKIGTTQIAEAFTINGGNNHFLTYYCQGDKNESLEIKLFDINNALISTHFLNLDQTVGTNRLRRLGVGVANLNNALSTDWRGVPPTQPLITNAVSYYEVRSVVTDAGLNVVNVFTFPFRLYVTNSCDQVQLFFCNEYGADDVILFKKNDVEIEYANNNQDYNSPFLTFPTAQTRGITTASSFAQTIYRLKGFFQQNRLDQLRELWASANIALLFPNETNYIMVTKLDNSAMVLKPARNGGVEFEINLVKSTIDNSQRN